MPNIDELLEEFEKLAAEKDTTEQAIQELKDSLGSIRIRMEEIRALIKKQAPATKTTTAEPTAAEAKSGADPIDGRSYHLVQAIKDSGKKIVDVDWAMATYHDSRKNAQQRLYRACANGTLKRVGAGRYKLLFG